MNKKAILEVLNDEIMYRNVKNNSFINRIKANSRCKKELNTKVKDISDVKVNLKNKSIYIVVEGEEIYVKLIEVPKVNKKRLYFIIKNELKYNFKDIDNIMFTYEVFKDNGNSLEVMVFCLNWTKENIIEKCVQRGAKVKGVYPIQFCALNTCKKNIRQPQYIFVFYSENKFYFIACVNKKVIANSTVSNLNENYIVENLNEFIYKCEENYKLKKFEYIFFLNFPNNDVIKKLSKKYNCTNLGNVTKDKLEVL